jgi:Flp pilus assembly protein TadD
MASDPKLLAAQAQDLKTRGQMGEAIALYRAAVAAAPASAAAEHNLAAVLGDAGRWQEAETHIRRAFAKGGTAAESWLVLARALQSRGAFDEAEASFLKTLQRRATVYDAHIDLAQLRWMRTGDSATALADIDRASLHHPGDKGLALTRAKILQNTGRIDEAYRLTQSLALSHPADLAIAVSSSQLASETGDMAGALAHAERAVALAPQNDVSAIALAIACLGAGDASRAATTALQVLSRAPHDQHAIALLATAWRLLGDARYHELYDYDALIQTTYLDTPPQWLRDALRRAHVLRTHPFNQSVRHGSQISDILAIEDPAIAALPSALEPAVSRYIANQCGAGEGPLQSRNRGGYAFQGMWSIRMQAGGFHVDHIHPDGWISSACYIETPDTDTGHEGWIRFGAPGVHTSPPLSAERFIKPEPGMLVLFPSYMWHGVVPYTDHAARMTVAFDLRPAVSRPYAI